MNTIFSTTPSALNVDIPGMAGSFAVSRKGEESGVVEVKYILTHVALGGGAQQQLLNMLAPVREVFDLEQLGFDEIMQRDIDDSRVSLDLIPYLLDHRNAGLVKLFPPIVVVVLPLHELSRKPANLYAKLEGSKEPVTGNDGFEWDIVTAGRQGKEQFQLRQLHRPDGTIDPQHSVLRLARENCALAIVDGQHRAMALLALYRNMTSGWSDARRAVYEQYYRVWSAEEIRNFDLTELQMPMIICTFPQLEGDYPGDMDVIRAARRVFLDLNKNAKKVSDSRNKLLDDQDMVSECLRGVLANIKAYDVNSTSPLRIWNVELDQAKDRSVVSSPVALTGVSHLYYIAEHLLFYSGRVKDVGAKKTFLARSRRLDEAYTRLGLNDELTVDERNENSRMNYSDRVSRAVVERWCGRYGKTLERILGKFHPFASHCLASLDVNERLKAANNTRLRALIFDGQASSRTFEEFNDRLALKMAGESDWKTPELVSIKKEVDAQLGEYAAEVERFRIERAVRFSRSVKGPSSRSILPTNERVASAVQVFLNDLYRDVFTSIAFQSAMFLTFFELFEALYDASNNEQRDISESDVDQYLSSLHRLFEPNSFDSFVRLVGVFSGELKEQDGGLVVTPTAWTFSKFVISGEMKPDEWPKYRYLILEVWDAENPGIKALIDEDLKECRSSVLRSAYRRALQSYCSEHAILEQDVGSDDKLKVLSAVVQNYESLLKNLKKSKVDLKEVTIAVQAQLAIISGADEEGEVLIES